ARRWCRLAETRVGEGRGDRILASAPATVLAMGEVVRDPIPAVAPDARHFPPHELVAFAEELLDAARAAVAHLAEQRAELTFDREAALGARDQSERVGQITGIGSRTQAADQGRAARPDASTDGGVRRAVVVDVLAVVQLRDRDPGDTQGEGDEPGR